MKKLILGLMCLATISVSAFAQKRFYIDAGAGLGIQVENIENTESKFNGMLTSFRLGFDGFFNDSRTLGIASYVSCDVKAHIENFDYVSGSDIGGNLLSFGGVYNFMVGPAFGVGDAVRFNVGAGFHTGFVMNGIWEGEENFGGSILPFVGFAVSPQLRFTANHFCSFVLGCDGTFDFYTRELSGDSAGNASLKSFKGTVYNVKPYIAFGINWR